MVALLLAIGILVLALHWLRRVVPPVVWRFALYIFPLVLLVGIARVALTTPAGGPLGVVAVMLLIGLVTFAVWRWRAGAASRDAAPTALARARGQMRKRLPPPAPTTGAVGMRRTRSAPRARARRSP